MGKLEEHESGQTEHIFLLMWHVLKVSSCCWLKSLNAPWPIFGAVSQFQIGALLNLATLAGKNTEIAEGFTGDRCSLFETTRSKEPALPSHMPKKKKTDKFEQEIVNIPKSNVYQPTHCPVLRTR